MSDLASIPAYDLVRRIDLRNEGPEGWFVLLRPREGERNFIEDLKAEAITWWNREIRVIDVSRKSVSELCHLLHQPSHDGVLIHGLEGWRDEQLQSLDIRRSSLLRKGFVVLWLTLDGIRRLSQKAPNLRSWIGGSQFQATPDPGWMSEDERHTRLAALSDHYKLNDDDVIRMAKAGTLPPDPEFAEWLVLLGRGNLVHDG